MGGAVLAFSIFLLSEFTEMGAHRGRAVGTSHRLETQISSYAHTPLRFALLGVHTVQGRQLQDLPQTGLEFAAGDCA